MSQMPNKKYFKRFRCKACRQLKFEVDFSYIDRHGSYVVGALCNPCRLEKNNRYKYRTLNAQPELTLWKRAKKRALKKGIEFSIDIGDIIIPTHCPILGIKISFKNPKKGKIKRDDVPSMDRIRNELGYVKGNIQIISWKANWLKGSLTPLEAKKIYLAFKRLGFYGQR